MFVGNRKPKAGSHMNRGLAGCVKTQGYSDTETCDAVRDTSPPPCPAGQVGRSPWRGASCHHIWASVPPLPCTRTGLPAGEPQAGPPHRATQSGPPGGVVVVLSPQLPEGDVLIEPQTVIAFLLGHVAPLLPASTGDRRGFPNAVTLPCLSPRPPTLIYRGPPIHSGEHLPQRAVGSALPQSLPRVLPLCLTGPNTNSVTPSFLRRGDPKAHTLPTDPAIMCTQWLPRTFSRGQGHYPPCPSLWVTDGRS